MNFIKNYIDMKWEYVDNNPRKSAWISWVKGLIVGMMIMVCFGCSSQQEVCSSDVQHECCEQH